MLKLNRLDLGTPFENLVGEILSVKLSMTEEVFFKKAIFATKKADEQKKVKIWTYFFWSRSPLSEILHTPLAIMNCYGVNNELLWCAM